MAVGVCAAWLCGTGTLKVSNSRWLKRRSTKASALSGDGAFHFLVASRGCVHSSASACSGERRVGRSPRRRAGLGAEGRVPGRGADLVPDAGAGLSPHEAGAQASQWLLWDWALAGPLDGRCPHPFCVFKTSYLPAFWCRGGQTSRATG